LMALDVPSRGTLKPLARRVTGLLTHGGRLVSTLVSGGMTVGLTLAHVRHRIGPIPSPCVLFPRPLR
jgi:hypothetical protein